MLLAGLEGGRLGWELVGGEGWTRWGERGVMELFWVSGFLLRAGEEGRDGGGPRGFAEW